MQAANTALVLNILNASQMVDTASAAAAVMAKTRRSR